MNPHSLDALIELIAAGDAHNGEDLARALGLSRAAVWKKIEALRALGVEIDGRPGSGYTLAGPGSWNRAYRIVRLLPIRLSRDNEAS